MAASRVRSEASRLMVGHCMHFERKPLVPPQLGYAVAQSAALPNQVAMQDERHRLSDLGQCRSGVGAAARTMAFMLCHATPE